jgi:hypothetical protein
MNRLSLCIGLVAALCSNVCLGEELTLIEVNGSIDASYACHPGSMAPGGTPQQSFYRAFKLSTFVNPISAPYFEVDSVFFVVGLAASGSGDGQPIDVNLYTTSAIPPTLASLTFVSTTTVTVPDESDIGSTATFSVPPLFNVATDTLVVEIASPDGTMSLR